MLAALTAFLLAALLLVHFSPGLAPEQSPGFGGNLAAGTKSLQQDWEAALAANFLVYRATVQDAAAQLSAQDLTPERVAQLLPPGYVFLAPWTLTREGGRLLIHGVVPLSGHALERDLRKVALQAARMLGGYTGVTMRNGVCVLEPAAQPLPSAIARGSLVCQIAS